MHVLISILHITMCILLIFVVLLQSGKGSDMGAAFGGSSQTVFGSSGPATFLGKMTSVIATIFMLTSLWLAYFAVHKTSSIMENSPIPAVEKSIPAADQSKGSVATPVETQTSEAEKKKTK